MAELTNETVPQESNPAQDRIKQLSEKVELTSRERDEKDALLKAEQQKTAQLEKENTFNSGFVDVLGTHPMAKDHKDEIKTKVLSGYSLEDATFAVLGKAGKLGAPAPVMQVAGGSASTAMPQGSQKEVKDMSQAERRAVLEKDLAWS